MDIRLPTPRQRQVSKWVWRIDDLIHERLTTLTHAAVTNGLRKDADYRQSGVRWIGEVPKSWKVARVSELASLQDHGSGRRPSGYYASGDAALGSCTIPCVCFGDLGHLQYNEKMREFTSGHPAQWVNDPGHRVLPRGTVVLSTVSHVGFCSVLDVPAAISWPFVAWIPGAELLSEYLLFCLRAMGPEMVRLTRAGDRRTLPLRSVWAFRVPVPPIEEQEAIVTELGRKYSHYRAVRERVFAAFERQSWSWRPWDTTGYVWFRDSAPPATK